MEDITYVKETDPSRPRGLPQKVGDFMNSSSRPSKNVDVIMGHYLSDTRIDQAIKNTNKPIIHTEYAHSLGLAFRFMDSYGRSKVADGKSEVWKEATDGIVYGDGYPQEDYFFIIIRNAFQGIVSEQDTLVKYDCLACANTCYLPLFQAERQGK